MLGVLDFAKDFSDRIGNVTGETERQAKDEAYRIRNEDIAREERWLERNSISGRISEGRSHGLSLSAASGLQPGLGAPTSVGLGDYMARAGQSSDSFFRKWSEKFLMAQLEGLQLDNLGKSQDLTSGGKQPVTGLPRPTMPKPFAASVDSKSSTGKDPSNILDYTYSEGQDGGYYVVPSEAAKERSEDNFVQERLWDVRNWAKPAMTGNAPNPPQVPLKDGYVWEYSPIQMAYFQVPRKNFVPSVREFVGKIMSRQPPKPTHELRSGRKSFIYRDSTGKLHKTTIPSWGSYERRK